MENKNPFEKFKKLPEFEKEITARREFLDSNYHKNFFKDLYFSVVDKVKLLKEIGFDFSCYFDEEILGFDDEGYEIYADENNKIHIRASEEGFGEFEASIIHVRHDKIILEYSLNVCY